MKNWIEEIENNIPDYFNELKNCWHSYSEECPEHQNPYHLEHLGNVWGHTLDVLKVAQERYPEDEILQLACLLHDVGKPHCRTVNHDTKRVHFFGHENFGVFKALEVLNLLNITEQEKIRALELIQRHADSYKLSEKNLKKLYNKEKLHDIIKIRYCDTLGRIKLDDDGSDLLQTQELEARLEEFPDIFTKNYKSSGHAEVLIGVPNSGKSTYTEESKLQVLSRDRILQKDCPNLDYAEAWLIANQEDVSKEFEKQRNYLIKNNHEFIVDTTNCTAKSRLKYTSEVPCVATVFLKDYATIMQRNQNRKGKVLQGHVIENMMLKFQLPYPGEGFRGIKYVF